jgi:hypothetical protein
MKRLLRPSGVELLNLRYSHCKQRRITCDNNSSFTICLGWADVVTMCGGLDSGGEMVVGRLSLMILREQTDFIPLSHQARAQDQ